MAAKSLGNELFWTSVVVIVVVVLVSPVSSSVSVSIFISVMILSGIIFLNIGEPMLFPSLRHSSYPFSVGILPSVFELIAA